MSAHPAEQSIVTFVRSLHQAVDRANDAALDRGAHIDCKAECSHCCNARVEAIAPEIFLIAEELAQRPAPAFAEMVDRLQARITASDQEALPWSHRKSCPFLEDHLCSIYPVRPATCRKGHSTNAGKCAAHAPEIPQNLDMILNAEALIKGTSGAYRQRGFDGSAHELVRAVLIALLDPTAQARWFNGEHVFDAAAPESHDRTAQPQIKNAAH
ncbi:YkgJ family cysteine cluster protein [Thiobacillus sp.]|uniref:YkgJ family cysteine cluster protein n=1 Tax=Thiobacillus sp. TaxID=924 RepID=UPI00286E9204|nr:YkgJ family cysteine cluster protein [Thiobacillus sp.]